MDLTTNFTLRPATVSDILDRTFRIYRNNFGEMLKLMLMIIVPLAVIGLFFNIQAVNSFANRQTGSLAGSGLGAAGIFAALSALIQGVVVNGTLTYMTSEIILGRHVTAVDALKMSSGRFLSLTGGLIYVGLLIFILSVGAVILIAICNILALGLGIAIYLIATSGMLLVPTLMLERTGVRVGVNRGAMLSRARFWSIMGTLFIIFVITTIISIALGLATSVATAPLAGSISLSAAAAIRSILQLVATILITPALPIAATLLYYDARIRLEGLDIALQAVGTPDARPSDVESPQANLSFRRSDTINLAILTAVGFVIALLSWASIQAFVRTFSNNGRF